MADPKERDEGKGLIERFRSSESPGVVFFRELLWVAAVVAGIALTLFLVAGTWPAVVTMLAVLRCGAAYVPVDPDHPPARQALVGRRRRSGPDRHRRGRRGTRGGRAARPGARRGRPRPGRMELAFINAILHSPEFPPHDPWLTGYAISYCYFGYVLVAMLAKITLVQGSIAFNLMIALIFGLSAVGAFGLVYNLLGALIARKQVTPSVQQGSPSLFYALLGPLFILVVSNLEGFLEVLHARGLFWSLESTRELTSRFWTWLDMKELSLPPAQPLSWEPTRYLWWWRASRVVQDYDLAGNWKEIIDEFPVFSFLLADLHPHVLAMPFAFLAMSMALNVFLGGGHHLRRWTMRPPKGPQSVSGCFTHSVLR